MNPLREARKRLFERHYYSGHGDAAYIEAQAARNLAPPTRMSFCKECGEAVRWFRETPAFSVTTGRPGHRYHLKCPHAHDTTYAMEHLPAGTPSNASNRARYAQALSEMHYDSGEYRWREEQDENRESTAADDLW